MESLWVGCSNTSTVSPFPQEDPEPAEPGRPEASDPPAQSHPPRLQEPVDPHRAVREGPGQDCGLPGGEQQVRGAGLRTLLTGSESPPAEEEVLL